MVLNVQGSQEFAQVRSLRNDVFERRKSTGSGLFAILRCDFDQIFGQIICMRVKTSRNTKARHIREKVQPRSQGRLLLGPRAGENPGNEVE